MLNKTFRLFVSSTFSDFLNERQILNDKIHKEISDFCLSKGYLFQLIDLRWGVNSESALTQNTLSICLEEVRRCKELSPRPNFLLMVGERYGWIPLPQKIAKLDFEEILSESNIDEIRLLQQWYQLDENELEPAYFLCTRFGEYESDTKWYEIENHLRAILTTKAIAIGFPHDKMVELTTSATEREIVEGLLANPNVGDNVIAIFRTGFPEKDLDLTAIQILREKIRKRMQHDQMSQNLVELNFNTESYAQQFETAVIDRLKYAIEEEIWRIETLKKENEDGHVLQSILDESGSTYCRPVDLIHQVQNYVYGKDNAPLFVVGEPGSGKSSMLADFLNLSKTQSFYVFFGYGDHSYNFYSALSFLSKSIQEHYNLSSKSEYCESANAFVEAIHCIPSEEKALIVIDGLDAFYDLDEIRENLIPAHLPENIRIIISSADKTVVRRFMGAEAQLLEIGHFSADESQDLLRAHLTQRGRCISNATQIACIEQALKEGATPLQIKLMATLCARWKSSDQDVHLPITAEEAALNYIRTMFLNGGHDIHLVLYALALVSVSPAGITEDMLTELLLKFAPVRENFLREDRYHHNLYKLPFVVWSRLFYDLKDGLNLAVSKGGVVVRFRHQIFKNIILRAYPEYCTVARNKLANYYYDQPHCLPNGTPNYLKLLTYPILLKENENQNILQSIFTDLSYIDASIKAGLMDSVVIELVRISNIRDCEVENKAKSILSCIQQYQERLICNRGDFLYCAYDFGLTNGVVPILSGKRNRIETKLHFPHSSDCKIAWADDGKRYTVFRESEVWLCNADPYLEEAHINVKLDIRDREVKISNALWLNQERIAIQLESGTVLIYSYSENSPHLYDQFPIDPKSQGAEAIQSMDAMAYIYDGKLYVRNISSKKVIYHIHKVDGKNVSFSISGDTEELIVFRYFSKIEEYDLRTGRKKCSQTIKLSKRHALWFSAFSGERFYVRKLHSKCWLLGCPTDLWFAVIDENGTTYLQVPSLSNCEKTNVDLLGKSFYIVGWDSLLMLIDITNHYGVRYYICQDVRDVAWHEMDNSISVLDGQGMSIINLSDFSELCNGGTSCLTSDLDLQHTMLFYGDQLNRNTSMIASLSKIVSSLVSSNDDAFLRYDILFRLEKGLESQVDKKATMVSFATDGKRALAYEGVNTIAIIDAEGNTRLVVDKLQLAINDNILNMLFSPDGNHLIIWRNHSIVAVDVDSGKCSLQLNTMLRPALSVAFDAEGCLEVVFCNRKVYSFAYNRKTHGFECDSVLPDKLVPSVDTDAFMGPYTVYPNSSEGATVPLINSGSFDHVPYLNLNQTRIYHGQNFWLLFENGEFYLNGNLKESFAHPYIDFRECVSREQRKDRSPLLRYLRARNDTISTLFEPDDRHLVLISRGLNAVLVFDVKENVVSAMYKIPGNIIGVQKANGTIIDLVCDTLPMHILIDLHLP